ncbi:MAG: GntR family transcriptional regulator, transcriptional repressor for pyruvate dehydrogenase complex [Pseudonocardiales bacterium]|nr:GntR family transcriptional regulator, transcriptional repressor for pyruvate dehydrogenase complex [Pseudonocardiales bacterium]
MTKPKRSQVIIDDYLRRIVTGDLREGAPLPTESSMVKQYGVSRTAVREAVQALAAKGFVEIRQGSGTTVASSVHWNVLDADYLQIMGWQHTVADFLIETRDIVEPAIGALAARRVTDEQLQRLRERAEAMIRVRSDDGADHAEADIEFHHQLAEATANPVLISLHASIVHIIRLQGAAVAADLGSVERAIFWHQHIVDAVTSRDPAAVEDAMRMHLRQVRADSTALEQGAASAEGLGDATH